MPIFDYVCDKCGKVQEKLVSRAEAESDASFDCGCKEDGKLVRSEAPTAAALRFKGQWFGTTGSY